MMSEAHLKATMSWVSSDGIEHESVFRGDEGPAVGEWIEQVLDAFAPEEAVLVLEHRNGPTTRRHIRRGPIEEVSD